MKNKTVILFLVIFNIVLSCIFFNADICKADTIFTDDFNSYVGGQLRGQGSWRGSSTAHVTNNSVVEGAQAFSIYDPYGYWYYAEKTGKSVNDGMTTIYVKRTPGWTTNPYVDIQLKEGTKIIAHAKGQENVSYFNGDSGLYVPLGAGFPANVWAPIQIQWRSSDHKIRYSVNGSAWTDWVKGEGEWAAGLDTVKISVTGGSIFVDAIGEHLFNEKAPVLIVPGLLGTEMKKGDEKLWLDLMHNFTDIGDQFMDSLQFNKSLTPSDIDIKTGDVINKEVIDVGIGDVALFDYAQGLKNEFKNQGYAENKKLFMFPYDWRYGVSGKYADGKTNADLLKQKIEEISQQTGWDKVDIVAHSLGGLVVKKYAADNIADNHIGKAVFVGVPNTGAPKAVKGLLQGDNFGIPWLADSEMKKISENLPVSYDLLPSQKYYDIKGSFVQTIDEAVLTTEDPFAQNIIKDLDYSETKIFITDDHGLNSAGMANGENLHSQVFDDFDIRTAGIDLYSINGCKSATIGKIIERRYKTLLGDNTDYKAMKVVVGDGTVPLASSTNLPIDQDNKYYALVSNHGKMLSQDGTRQQIVNLISGSSLSTVDIFGHNLISQNIGECELNGTEISVFSPVNIFATDQNGNKLALADDNSIINEIPNADFEIWGDHKFIYVPTDENQTYTINLAGTGSGTFTLKAEEIKNSQTIKTEVFSNLPVTQELAGQIVLPGLGNGQVNLIVRQTPTGEPETILPSSTIDAEQSGDLLPPVSTAKITGTAGQPGFFRSDAIVNITALDNLSGVLDIEYNLDNAGYQKVFGDSANVNVAGEGNHTINFFSADRAGNNEQEQTITFTIDKTAPEAIIEFDLKEKDLKFTSKEDNVTILDNDNKVVLTDQAGNTMEIILKEKNRKKLMQASIKSIKYNGTASAIKNNFMQFSWAFNKNKKLAGLSQHVISKKDFNILAKYNGKNTQLTGKDETGKIKKTVSGLNLIKVETKDGDFSWRY